MEVLVFGGTVEGRELVEWLDARGCDVVACVTTEYGESLLPRGGRVACVRGPLSHEEKLALVAGHNFRCIVDATHPFARHITQSVEQLGKECGLDVLRIAREASEDKDGWESVPDAAHAANLLADLEGNILLTTGSKDLEVYVRALPDFAERLHVRILPLESAVAHAHDLGIPASHIIAMQGPFSKELNVALMRQLDIRHLVTKQSGQAGGFDEKVQAAQECGAHLVVIERPPEQEGVSLSEALSLLEGRYGL